MLTTPRTALTAAALFAGVLLVAAQGFKPDVAASKMRVPAGFTVDLIASEPLVRQPVAIDFDDRGRLWVLQYLQYPNPAGLTRSKVDRYSRTAYDHVPDPPPRGPKGADRLTIVPDRKDFVAGLNLASGFAFGHGGVYVLQVPYLLFYPDRDGDDVPDDDPDVLLAGFGMEDAHSVANSLTWGPDGWLYGCQGSTVTANVRGVGFQQGVWRFHPPTRRFELFCEGGGNSWGLDFDRHGHLLYSTNHGGHVLLHGVQGGYYWKAFAKHGPLHHPHAYGYFDHAMHTNFRGGHVTVGGLVYRGDSFPDRYRDRYVAADLLGHNVHWHDVVPIGSTFRTRHGGELLVSNDTWFAPSDVVMGPDGAVYVADWHDARTAHPDPDAEWDRSNGRVYRVAAKGTKHYTLGDVRKLSSTQLVELLGSRNDWLVRRARRVLADRRDPEVTFPLRDLVRTGGEPLALEALWALFVSGGFTEAFAAEALGHANPHVRRWAVRFLGDDRKASPDVGRRLVELAASEPHPVVRSQLAASARRLPPAVGLPMVTALVKQDKDTDDPHIPLLLWWALEQHLHASLPDVVTTYAGRDMLASALAREAIHPRLVRRLAALGTDAGLAGCTRLLASAPADLQPRLLAELDHGLAESATPNPRLPPALAALLGRLWDPEAIDLPLLRLLLRLDLPGAHRQALVLVRDARAPLDLRLGTMQALAEFGDRRAPAALVQLLDAGEEQVRLAALDALARFDDPALAAAILKAYPKLSPRLRAKARNVLLGRRSWARLLVSKVEDGAIDGREVTPEELQALPADADLDRRVRKLWGRVQPPTPEEKLAEVRRLTNDLRAAAGDAARGKPLFKKLCASCHKLHGDGAAVGPDLTHANRKDRQFLLVSLIDPSAVIRKEYVASTVQTLDGRVLTGLVTEDAGGRLTLVDAKGEKAVVAKTRIEHVKESPVSLMPENLLKPLTPSELRDLFAYLQGDQP